MQIIFTVLAFVFIAFSGAARAQGLLREFAYASVTYQYQVKPTPDSTVYHLRIQAMKSREQGITVYKGNISAIFNPRQWRISIYATQKKKGDWATLANSYVESNFDLNQQKIYHFENGTLANLAEATLTENFSGEWAGLARQTAIATAVEYYLINYSRSLGQHEVGEELETEEAIMVDQMMAERQAERDRQVAAAEQQKQRALDSAATATALPAATAQPDSAAMAAPQALDSAATAAATATALPAATAQPDSAAMAAPQALDSAATAAATAPALPAATAQPDSAAMAAPQAFQLVDNFQLPFSGNLEVNGQQFFVEIRQDEFKRMELKLRQYQADSNSYQLLYVGNVRVQDSTAQTGEYRVFVHLAEHHSYQWKNYPSSFLECSLDIAQRKLAYRVTGKLASHYLRSPESQQKEEALPTHLSNMQKTDVLLAAVRYFVAECDKALDKAGDN